MAPSAALRPSAAVSRACLVLGAASFLTGWVLLSVAAPDLIEFFYETRVLAVVHTFTLGWITPVMFGVLYQFVPALTKRPLLWPRAAGWQVGTYAVGASGMVAHFWIGHLTGMVWSAAFVALGVFLFVAEMLPALLAALRRDPALAGILAAVLYLAGTATLGLMLATDKVYPFLGGSTLSNLAAHAHLGLLGWITLTICAVSYRMVTAFLLPDVPLPASAFRQIVLMIGAVPALFVAFLLRSPLVPLAGLLVLVALAWYAAILGQVVRRRRMPLDWSLRHVLAALGHLSAAVAGALFLLVVEPESETGSRLVVLYGLLLLVGWVSNYIFGVGNRMAGGIMGRGGTPLLPSGLQATVFLLLNGGIVLVGASVVLGSVDGLRLASGLPLAAAGLFGTAILGRAIKRDRRAELP